MYNTTSEVFVSNCSSVKTQLEAGLPQSSKTRTSEVLAGISDELPISVNVAVELLQGSSSIGRILILNRRNF